MNNYSFIEVIGFPFNHKNNGSTSLNFFFWKVILFLLFPFAAASIVDESYSSSQDVYDALLNTLFPITFVILFNVSKYNNGESEKKVDSEENEESEEAKHSGKYGEHETRILREKLLAKENLLPLLDDLLYNTVTWVIPLIVSFSYDDLLSIKIFSVINACLHITCAIHALIHPMSIDEAERHKRIQVNFFFLIFFPIVAIPVFWIVYIVINHEYDLTSTIFLILFGTTLFLSFGLFMLLFMFIFADPEDVLSDYFAFYLSASGIFLFYTPNILQALLIMLKWPINFYFVKTFVFILILSLTRNTSYFNVDEVPRNFLASSTAYTQWELFDQKRDSKKEIDIKKKRNSSVV
ncbi:1132_t:CDS:1 [Acaulospora morrowiae]|uniref:1132_t:CDS:1 n=1 Tax=Acaulospora morrowiae TaxID=94023 RepID=A0A9N8V6Y1_9GLOM|nr:1132_t:CDS:1 [Acaulospora morrowiae]